MALLKVIEVVAESDRSWEDAAQNAVRIAAQTVRRIKSISVQNFDAAVTDDYKIARYRISAKISFVVEGEYGASSG